MTTHLPQGIVAIAEPMLRDIRGIDKIAIEDLLKLWRVNTTNKDVLKDGTGRRLENLFWRILGNETIKSRISGHSLAAIVAYILTIRPVEMPITPRREAPKPKLNVKPILKTSKRDLVALREQTKSEPSPDKQKKRTSFVAGTKRRRPTLPLRKSSSQTHTPTMSSMQEESPSSADASSGSYMESVRLSRPQQLRKSSLRRAAASDIELSSADSTDQSLPRSQSHVDWKVPNYPLSTPSGRASVVPAKISHTSAPVAPQITPTEAHWERPGSEWVAPGNFRASFAARKDKAAPRSQPVESPSESDSISSDEISSDDDDDDEVETRKSFSASNPLSRSESQLTLVLMRDRARANEARKQTAKA